MSVPNHPKTHAPDSDAVRRVLLLTFVLNLIVAAAKGAYGLWSGSLAVASDAVHSLLDAGSNIVGWITLRHAAEPPDAEHPYGHRKVEVIAAAFLGVLIGVGALEFGWSAISALLGEQRRVEVDALGFVVVGATLAVNLFVAAYESRRAKELGSHFLEADAAHTASDVLVTVGVLVSMALTKAGLAWADSVGALIVLLIVVRIAWRVLAENLDVLVDRAAVDAAEIERIALTVPEVLGCHRVRSRGTPEHFHLDCHLLLPGDLPLTRAHALSHQVEDRLHEALPGLSDVTIHIEPDHDEPEAL